ncbi:MAG: response regulator [Anaerolineae bacterium]|nr:response regulator [Anaerolineae bacterium]
MSAETLSATPERNIQVDRAELREQVTSRITLFLVLVTGVAAWMSLRAPHFLSRPSLLVLSAFAVALAALWCRSRAPGVARALILFGPTAALAAALKVTPGPSLPYLAIPIISANLAIDPRLGLVAAAMNSASVIILVPSDASKLTVLVVVWLVVGIQLISAQGLYAVLGWAWNSHDRANRLLAELRARQGQLNQTVAALTEATRRLERTNRELVIARQEAQEARAVKEQFVANVSHELRTPLNLIVGFTEMMYANPDSYEGVVWTPELESDIGEVYLASRHLQSLVGDILDLARIDASRLPMFRELVDVREIVADAVAGVAPLYRQRGLYCRVEHPNEMPLLLVDRTRIRQVMVNLLNNAVRFTDEGGVTVRIEVGEDAVTVSVADTGVGIATDQLEAIFEEFRQVSGPTGRRGGTGLGLALSRQFIALHGGRMWAQSQENVGSTFYFTLPLPGARPQTAELRRTPDRWRADWSEAPIVVVDPDPGVAEMVGRHLDRRALSARDAAAAEKLIDAVHPVLVIVNQSPDCPPEAWFGPLGELSERSRVPIVRCSIASPSWLQQAAGLDGCLTKPVSRESLRQVVQTHLEERGAVLVVDDNPGFVTLVQRMLADMPEAGEVFAAYSGAEALRVAREKRPQLVLLDLLMPEVDGFAVLRELRKEASLQKTRVVAVTATSYPEEVLSRESGRFSVTQTGGLAASQTIELLRAAVRLLHPEYWRGEESASESA